jgi:protocatechuate 3,4-dioxygenase beta subunit
MVPARRAFLQAALAVPACVLRAQIVSAQGLGDFGGGPPPCNPSQKPTPAAPAGPDFKAGSPQRTSLLEPALGGEKLVLTGFVSGVICGPIKNARLDFWQPDAHGAYDTAGFRLRGYQLTDANGGYRLETIVPGPSAGRAPTIHVKVQPPGKPAFTTQLFFAARAENTHDPAYRPELELKLSGSATSRTAHFNIFLNL